MVVAIVIVINSVIGGFSREDLINRSDYSQLCDYTVRLQLHKVIGEK